MAANAAHQQLTELLRLPDPQHAGEHDIRPTTTTSTDRDKLALAIAARDTAAAPSKNACRQHVRAADCESLVEPMAVDVVTDQIVALAPGPAFSTATRKASRSRERLRSSSRSCRTVGLTRTSKPNSNPAR